MPMLTTSNTLSDTSIETLASHNLIYLHKTSNNSETKFFDTSQTPFFVLG